MLKTRLYSVFLFLVITCLGIKAENKVRLTLLETKTKLPIVSALIQFSDNEELKNARNIITNQSGKVIITFPEKQKCYLHISSIGFIPLDVTLDSSLETVLYMDEDIMGLEQVVVTGSRAPRPIKLSPITTQVLSGQAMVNAGYGNLQQALQQETPGLNIQKVGFGNEISMQGLDARHVLFLMDGERMTGDMAGNLDYERFNLHALDRVEIVKGASSTLYGSRASGAVINLITKKTNKPLSIDVGLRYAQMNERNYKDPQRSDFQYMFEKNADRPNLQSWISAGFKAGPFTSQTDVWYSESDAFYLYQSEKDRKVYYKEANPFLDKDIVIESVANRPPMGIEGSEHLSISQKIYFNPHKNFTALVYGSAFYMNTYDMIQDLVFSQSRDWTGGVKMTYSLKDWFTVTGSLHTDYYDRFKRHERLDYRDKVYKSRILQPRFTISSNYFKEHNLIFGIEHITDDLTSDRFVKRKMTTRSLNETEYFLQDEWDISAKWMLSVGIRTNFSEQFGFMGMPKFAIKFSPNEHWSFRGNYSMGYRSPSIKELFFNWDHLGMFQIKGNEFMKPEKNNYFSIGAEYNNSSLFLSTTLYGNFFRDKIEGVWRIYDLQYNFEYTNLNSQRLLGGELLGRWQMADFLMLNVSYSYVNVSKQEGIQVNTTSPHAVTAGLEYRYNKPNYQLSARFNTSFMSKKKFEVQDRVYIEAEGRSRDAYFRCELPAYALCNVSVLQTFWNKMKLTLGVDNVFNYKPKTLGSGVTLFNVPATAGFRGYVQVEFMLGDIIKSLKKK